MKTSLEGQFNDAKAKHILFRRCSRGLKIRSTKQNLVKINSYIPRSSVEGPGLRFAIWVQGCSIRCKGCANTHMWERGGGHSMPVDELLAEIEKESDIEGITIVGGEPFDQAKSLTSLADKVHKIGLGVIVFTGHVYETLLNSGTPDQHALLDCTDLLIDGPFIRDLATNDLPWVGSSNQRYINLSLRYDQIDLRKVDNCVEIRYDAEGKKIIVNGMDDLDQFKKVFDRLRDKGK